MKHEFSIITQGIAKVLDVWEPKLRDLSEDIITSRSNSQNRTIKQIIGHLCDSAANNHQRIVRLQYNADLNFPDYTQDNDLWISIQNYQEADWYRLVSFWRCYNWQLIQVISNIDVEQLDNVWTNRLGVKLSLREVVENYFWHVNHHLKEIDKILSE